MGVRKTRERSGDYLKVKHGALVRESKEKREDYEEIQVTNPQTGETIIKYVEKFQALEGRIRQIKWYDTEEKYDQRYMGIKLKVVDDEGETFFLDLPYGKRPYTIFTKVMENIQFEDLVEFNAWMDRKTDKTAFVIRQYGHPIKWKYTKDNPGECPVPKPKKPKGWDFSDQNEYLYSVLTDTVIPHVKELYPDEVDFDEEVLPDDVEEQESIEESPARKKKKEAVTGPDKEDGF